MGLFSPYFHFFNCLSNARKKAHSIKQICRKIIYRLDRIHVKLNKKFKSIDNSASSQVDFNKTIAEVTRELNSFKRPELKKSDSQKQLLYLSQNLELLHTGKTDSYSTQVMQKLQTPSEQIATDLALVYEQSLMRELLENDALWNADNLELKNEIIYEYLSSSQKSSLLEIETIKLNQDSQLTLIENISDIVKDSYKILRHDFPMTEIGDYAHETLCHPVDYIIRAAKDFGQLGHFLCSSLVDYGKNNLSIVGATNEDIYEYSKKYNEAVHKFSENWKNLDPQYKKEFVAKLIVDLAANKALGCGAKLISQVMGDCIISMGEIIPPSMSGGNMLAVPQNIALIQEMATEVAGVVQGVGEVIGSTPFGPTAIQGVESLFDCMARATRENAVPFYAEGSHDYLEKCVKLHHWSISQ